MCLTLSSATEGSVESLGLSFSYGYGFWAHFVDALSLTTRHTSRNSIPTHASYQSPSLDLNQESDDVETLKTCPGLEGIQRVCPS